MLQWSFQFRAISIIEGISYLILVFLVMPLKYLFEEPMAVKIFGMMYGIFFFYIFLYSFIQCYETLQMGFYLV